MTAPVETAADTSLTLRGLTLKPARVCAPLAELTHSAFRRLLGDYGGCGAHYTEMLAARKLLHEDPDVSPYLKRHHRDIPLFYQLLFSPEDPVERIVERVAQMGPDGIDLNLACYAPVIRNIDAGARMFENPVALARILRGVRAKWNGPLTVKIRLGSSTAGSEGRFVERLRVLEDGGVDAIALHVRFFEDKFKRRARHEMFAWATAQTRLPIIANGDLTGPAQLRQHATLFSSVSGFMLGRMAVAQPWLFAGWHEPVAVDYPEVWHRLCRYIEEDFEPAIAIRRLRLFTKYYGRNFHFGHTLTMAIQNAPDLATARARCDAFFAVPQPVFADVSLLGL